MTSAEETNQAIVIIVVGVGIGLPILVGCLWLCGYLVVEAFKCFGSLLLAFWWELPKALLVKALFVGEPKKHRPELDELVQARERLATEPRQRQQPAPKYHAHANDGSIIGTFDTILDAEVYALRAAGVKAVDLPLVLHERRRLGTYGSLREPEPAGALQPNRPAGPTGPSGRTVGVEPISWGERIQRAPDLRKAYPPKRLSDCRGPYR